MWDSFFSEMQKIASVGGALTGAALGAVAAGTSGNENHMGKAMLSGALLGSGASRKGGKLRYNPKVPVGLAAAGGAGYVGYNAIPRQVKYDTDVADEYANTMMAQPGIEPGQWM